MTRPLPVCGACGLFLLLGVARALTVAYMHAAGADIKEMHEKKFVDVHYVCAANVLPVTRPPPPLQNNFLAHWSRVASANKPVLADVNWFDVLFGLYFFF